MRTLLVLGSVSLVSLAAAALPLGLGCDTTPMLTVTRVRAGDSVQPVRGDNVKFKRGPQETYGGVRGGYFVVRTMQDWHAMWSNAPKEPPVPPALDTVRQMLVLAVSESKWTQELKVQRVVDTGTIVDVWIKETRVGQGCEPKKIADAFDAVVVDRLDKPVRFLVVEQGGDACGDPPIAQVKCRIDGTPTWANEITAQPGDRIDCEMTAQSMGRFVVVDRLLSLSDMPGGSAAKLAFSNGPTRATFAVDVFGTYAVRAEATDEADRRGASGARIVAAPPKSKDVHVELVWSGFDANDDADTFPRLSLHAREEGPKGRTCGVDSALPGLCEVKRHSAYTHMKLAGGDDRSMALSVTYTDERIEKGPLACVQLWFDGQRTAETCDRKHRDPDDVWSVGYVDLATGKLLEAGPATAGPVDAGAPDAAAAKPAKPAAPPKKK